MPYYCSMADNALTQPRLPFDIYPKRIVFIRWLFLSVEAVLALYFVFSFQTILGIIFLAYGVVCLFLIYPLFRCVRCGYYGKRCNFGWGRFWVSKLFPKDDGGHFGDNHGWSMLFWPLRIIPIVLGLRELPLWILGKFSFTAHGLFIIYLAILFLHRRFYRARACTRCHQMAICPIYTGRINAPEII
jgi:hypothetical protein